MVVPRDRQSQSQACGLLFVLKRMVVLGQASQGNSLPKIMYGECKLMQLNAGVTGDQREKQRAPFDSGYNQ